MSTAPLVSTGVAGRATNEAQRRFPIGIGGDMLQADMLGRATPPEEAGRLAQPVAGITGPSVTAARDARAVAVAALLPW
jgi:hypothetical protein